MMMANANARVIHTALLSKACLKEVTRPSRFNNARSMKSSRRMTALKMIQKISIVDYCLNAPACAVEFGTRKNGPRALDGCINSILFKKEIMLPASRARSFFFLHTHSLRCGLEECRQLCWLWITADGRVCRS